MSKASPKERHDELVREIEAHNYRYYVLDDPIVTRRGVRRAAARAARARGRAPGARRRRTRRPSASAASRARASCKVKHEVRMFSLDNAYSEEDLAEFCAAREGRAARQRDARRSCVEPKLDGASVEVDLRERRASSSRARAATARSARTSRTTCAPIRGVPLTDRAQGQAHPARRGPHLPQGPRRAQRRARSGGPRAVREPAQRRGGRGAHARPARGARKRRLRALLLPARRRRRRCTRRHARVPRVARGAGPADAPPRERRARGTA